MIGCWCLCWNEKVSPERTFQLKIWHWKLCREHLHDLANERWPLVPESVQQKMASMAASAAWGLGEKIRLFWKQTKLTFVNHFSLTMKWSRAHWELFRMHIHVCSFSVGWFSQTNGSTWRNTPAWFPGTRTKELSTEQYWPCIWTSFSLHSRSAKQWV